MASSAVILLAEDDENDVFLMRRAFKKAGVTNQLLVVRNGKEAIDYLSGQPPFANPATHPRPGLLMLDLKMPLLNGFDVLLWLQKQPNLSRIPVLVFSSSDHEVDRQRVQQLGASDYLVKPHDFRELVKIIGELHSRWFVEPGKNPRAS
jgi:DNA-binding response OmpR family regulator